MLAASQSESFLCLRGRRARLGIISAAAVIVAGGSLLRAAPPATQATSAPSQPVDRVLATMEAREVENLRARVEWRVQHLIDDTPNIKRGTIWYRQFEPVSKFKVEFREQVVAGRRRALDEAHLFDGQWYVEKNSRSKTVTRRQVRRGDEQIDPYKLGEGPFPVPFGQKREDIQREFVVSLFEPADADPPDTDHLLLVPRKGTQTADRFAKIHLWVVRSGPLAGLPIKVTAAKKAPTGRIDSEITLRFEDVDLNEGLAADEFTIETPAGWQEIVEDLEPIPVPRPQAEGS